MSGLFDDPKRYELETVESETAPEKRNRPKTQGQALAFPDVEPWVVPVDGEALLSDLSDELRRLIVIQPEQADAVALWTVHTYALPAAETSPILAVVSPVKRCGKTRLHDVLRELAHRPMSGQSCSESAIFRTVQKYVPTLFLDEMDSLKDNEGLRTLFNSGISRGAAWAFRVEGRDQHEVRQFSTFCPKSLALIGKLPDTIRDRAIMIEMRRKERSEKVARVKERRAILHLLRRKILRWIGDTWDTLRDADPETPESLNDRESDLWEPLLAIADAAGPAWGARARKASITLCGGDADEVPGIGEQLLFDLRGIFNGHDAVYSSEAVESLNALEGRPWADWNHGKGLTANALARLLQPFGIAPRDMRRGEKVAKGYRLEALRDTFTRYLPPSGNGSVAVDVALVLPFEHGGSGASVSHCSAVAVETPPRESGHGDAWEGEAEP